MRFECFEGLGFFVDSMCPMCRIEITVIALSILVLKQFFVKYQHYSAEPSKQPMVLCCPRTRLQFRNL